MSVANELSKHCSDYGIEGLLPQNLTDFLLDKLLEEIMSMHEQDKKMAPTLLLLIVLSLKNGHCITTESDTSIKFKGEKELMDSFANYELAITLEVYRRDSKIQLSKDSLPTIENIFDKNRNVTFTEINL